MDHTEHPTRATWDERRDWFWQIEAETRGELASYFVSEQASALVADVQAAFCAGAWVAVVIVAVATIEAQLVEYEAGAPGSLYKMIESIGGDQELHALRRRRNALVHLDPEAPGVTVEDQWRKRTELETDARRAVKSMFAMLYSSPGT